MDRKVGGPVAVVELFASAQAMQGDRVRVLCCDDQNNCRENETVEYEVISVGKGHGGFGYSGDIIPAIRRLASDADTFIVHGVYDYILFATWFALKGSGIPMFVYSHGALDPWFGKYFPRKELKKRLYWRLIMQPVLRTACGVIFTNSEEEKLANITVDLADCESIVAPLGISVPPGEEDLQKRAFYEKFPQLGGKKFWLFFSRVDKKKGVDILLRAFDQIATSENADWLVVAGPANDPGYMAELKSVVAAMAPEVSRRIVWAGMLTGNEKWGALRSADVFILPSHSENFCVALVEALACRLPVLSTRRVNIWREVEGDSAGLFTEDTLEEMVVLMRRWRLMTTNCDSAMRLSAVNCFSQRYEIDAAATHLKNEMKKKMRKWKKKA